MAPKAIILLYHRVAEVPADPQLLCVSPRRFAEHLEVLQRSYHPLSLGSLRRRLALNFWPPRSVVVTFDDGYADNLHQARPLLEAVDVPATVFVTAGQVDSQQEFWWDELERILLSTPTLPAELALHINGQLVRWDVGQKEGDGRPDNSWHVLMETQPTPRQTVYKELAGRLRPMAEREREAALAQLCAWAGQERTARPAYRSLSADELSRLAGDGLVEVGAHTVTHSLLAALPLDAQRAEIAHSKRRLEEILNRPVTSFSYPFGGHGDYTAATTGLARDAGFRCACANFPGQIRWRTDPYQLPRFLVRDWDGEEFARRLEGWFGG